ncbi:hypothetical protein LTR40_003938 [Exophiala xenobiotica]|nr:hypothetical protein LTS06_010516 [Exophiala xenobiotica]KAK5282011.1 hypothetical protein LTR40_003938 [Exophiala xenobiotica]
MAQDKLLWSFVSGLLVWRLKVVSGFPHDAYQPYMSRASVPAYIIDEIPLVESHGLHISQDQESCKLASTSRHLNEGFGSDPTSFYVPSSGVLQARMIFIDFEDAPASENPVDLFDLFMPAASEWYGNASFGRLNLRVAADLSGFYRMPCNASTYVYHRGMSYEAHHKYIQDALDAVGKSVMFAGTDLLYIVPTEEAAAISYSPTFMPPIEAHDGTLIKKTVTFGQDAHFIGFKEMNHETGHTMGLPDLYSYEPYTRAGIFVGGYDLMAQIEGISPDFLAWHKWRLGWIDDDQIFCLCPDAEKSKAGNERTIVLTPVEEPQGLKALVVRHNVTVALVAENQSGRHLDTDTCGSGVLIYRIDTMTDSGHGPIKVQDSSPDSGGCAGDELNDALFVPGHKSRSSFTSSELGVSIEVLEEIEEGFVVSVSLL